MDLPFDQVLEILRTQQTADMAWENILNLCRMTTPSGLWDVLPMPDTERDISAATAWLTSQLIVLSEIQCIYLGLDTLNMAGGHGTNIEIAGTADCGRSQDGVDLILKNLQYGSKHLIYGLYQFHTIYSQPQWRNEFSFADYIVFLAYSGIVLGQAFIRLSTEKTLLSVWGFHDGDLFVLGRKSPEGFEFICK